MRLAGDFRRLQLAGPTRRVAPERWQALRHHPALVHRAQHGQRRDQKKQNWLVVTKLDGAEACHIAYIDAKYADANVVARQRADEKTATFNCAKDLPEIFSSRGGVATDYASGMPCPGGPYREE